LSSFVFIREFIADFLRSLFYIVSDGFYLSRASSLTNDEKIRHRLWYLP
jgi:hypothetical protein